MNNTLYVQQRFDEMEAKINDLRDQIETIKAEKSRLEKQIEVESEVNFYFFFLLITPVLTPKNYSHGFNYAEARYNDVSLNDKTQEST